MWGSLRLAPIIHGTCQQWFRTASTPHGHQTLLSTKHRLLDDHAPSKVLFNAMRWYLLWNHVQWDVPHYQIVKIVFSTDKELVLSCAPLLPIQWMSHTHWNHKCVFHTKFTLHITHTNIDERSDEHWLSPEVVLIRSLSQRHHVKDCNFRRNCTFCCARQHAGCCRTCVWIPPSKKGMECCLKQLPEQLLWSVHLQVFCYMLEPVPPTREWRAKTHHSTLWHHRYCG